MKKGMSLFLTVIILLNATLTSVKANEVETSQKVYVDGVEFSISVNDDMEIVVDGSSGENEAHMLLNSCGEAELDISNEALEEEIEEYELKIDNLEYDDVDVEIYQEEELVEEYLDLDDIVEDEYDGQVSIALTGGAVITVGMVLEALLAAALAVVIAGVLYIVITKFYSTVQTASKTKREKAKKLYYPAYIWNGKVAIASKAITKSKAISRVKKGQSVYSFSSSMARSIIKQAGYSYFPTGISGEIDKNRKSGNIYLYHYHKANKKGHVLHDGFHSFYGSPVRG